MGCEIKIATAIKPSTMNGIQRRSFSIALLSLPVNLPTICNIIRQLAKRVRLPGAQPSFSIRQFLRSAAGALCYDLTVP